MPSIKELLKNSLSSENGVDLRERISKDIKRVREPGEAPKADPIEMDVYLCDLCKAKVKSSEIIQCGLCGRWVCRDQCWDAENHVCESCLGIINIHREAVSDIKEVLRITMHGGVEND